MVVDQREAVKLFANPMSRKLLRDRIPISICNGLDRLSNPIEGHTWTADCNGFVQRFLGSFDQLPASLIHVAN